MSKIYKSSIAHTKFLLIFFAPLVAIMLWVGGVVIANRQYSETVLPIVIVMLVALYCTHEMTTRVEMDDHSLTRTWLLGRTVVPLNQIRDLSLSEFRGVRLQIGYGKKHITLSSSSLEEYELREIKRRILTSLDLEGEPELPLFTEGRYINVAEMIARKHIT